MPVNKNNRGGKRPNSGRKRRTDERRWRSIKMPLTDVEFTAIKTIPPEDRREILLQVQGDEK